MRRLAPFCLLLALATCGPLPPTATLPADAVQGSADPTRSTILRSAHVFNAPGELAGHPAEAARALAGMEYLATEIPQGPRWFEFNPQLTFDLQAARAEWRAALGISPAALPQPVMDALFAVARGAGAAALPPALFPQPAESFARLGALPPLPRTALAAAQAQQELNRVDFMGRTSPGGDSVGGRGQ